MNKTILTNALIFAVGAAIGSAVTWKLVKTKYEKIAEEEINSVKEAFSSRSEKPDDSDKADKSDKTDKTVIEPFHVDESVENAKEKEAVIRKAQEIAAKMGYSGDGNDKEVDDEDDAKCDDEEEDDDDMYGPYVISPEEFGEEDYVIITLIYYTDGVVANEAGKVISNTDELIGKDFEKHFGDYDYDPDTVYVRNDEDGVDYEIQKDYRAYSEIS